MLERLLRARKVLNGEGILCRAMENVLGLGLEPYAQVIHCEDGMCEFKQTIWGGDEFSLKCKIVADS